MEKKMAAVVATMMAMVVYGSVVETAMGAMYAVGDSAGWTTIGNVDYKQWAATKSFKVGDTIVFTYNKQFHNVMQVTHADYRSCNVSAPITTHSRGNDSITIKTYGHHFFLCAVPGHCQAGQRLDINVEHDSSSSAPSPSASGQPTSTSLLSPSSAPASATVNKPNAVEKGSSSTVSVITVGMVMAMAIAVGVM